jgi:hypothetical protein
MHRFEGGGVQRSMILEHSVSNMDRSARYLTILLVIFLSFGCVQHQPPYPPAMTLTASIAPVRQLHLPQTASPTTTRLLLTHTPPPTLTLTPVATPTLRFSPTSTQLPKLTLEQQKQQMSMLLRTNGNCSSPCVWGIIPGQTTLAEARNFLLKMDQIVTSPPGYPQEFSFDSQYGYGHGYFTLRKEIIVGVRLSMTLSDHLPRSDWKAFTPEEILRACLINW